MTGMIFTGPYVCTPGFQYYEREREREKGNVTVRKCELAGTKEYDGTGKKEVRNGN